VIQPHHSVTTLLACLTLSSSAVAVDNSRSEIREFIAEMQRDYEFDSNELAKLLTKAETKQNILDAISRPAERVVPWYEYRQQFLNPQRIQYGTRFRDEHPERLKAIGDPQLANTVLGILGVETSYGRITGKFRVIDALTTLAFDYPPRGEFFRGELQQFLLLTREEAIDPSTALGSYAGAMGSPQFISSSYRKYAIDADGDGRRAFGWRGNEEVVVDASLQNADLSRFNVAKIDLNETVQSLRTKGVQFETRMPDEAPAMLIVAQGKDGPMYRVGFNNFYVITRYNRSTMYAMAVHDLGEAVAGASQ
jgi:membrane-bound lytic murein transglycosylase B